MMIGGNSLLQRFLLRRSRGASGNSKRSSSMKDKTSRSGGSRRWISAPAMFATHQFYVFADTHQQLYRTEWQPPDDMPRALALTINCRSTVSIANRAAGVFGEASTSRVVWTDPLHSSVKCRAREKRHGPFKGSWRSS